MHNFFKTPSTSHIRVRQAVLAAATVSLSGHVELNETAVLYKWTILVLNCIVKEDESANH